VPKICDKKGGASNFDAPLVREGNGSVCVQDDALERIGNPFHDPWIRFAAGFYLAQLSVCDIGLLCQFNSRDVTNVGPQSFDLFSQLGLSDREFESLRRTGREIFTLKCESGRCGQFLFLLKKKYDAVVQTLS